MVKDTLCGKLSWPSSSNTVPYSSSSSTYICGFYFIFRCHSHSSFRDSPIYLYNFGLSMETDAFFWPPHIPKYHKPEEKRQRPITNTLTIPFPDHNFLQSCDSEPLHAPHTICPKCLSFLFDSVNPNLVV